MGSTNRLSAVHVPGPGMDRRVTPEQARALELLLYFAADLHPADIELVAGEIMAGTAPRVKIGHAIEAAKVARLERN